MLMDFSKPIYKTNFDQSLKIKLLCTFKCVKSQTKYFFCFFDNIFHISVSLHKCLLLKDKQAKHVRMHGHLLSKYSYNHRYLPPTTCTVRIQMQAIWHRRNIYNCNKDCKICVGFS